MIARSMIQAAANGDLGWLIQISEFARASGAVDMYANTFPEGMWERSAREDIGLACVLQEAWAVPYAELHAVGETVVVKASSDERGSRWARTSWNLSRARNSKGVLTVARGPVKLRCHRQRVHLRGR